MQLVRSLVNAEVKTKDGKIKNLESGHQYEVTGVDADTTTYTIYFANGDIVVGVDQSAFELYNVDVRQIKPVEKTISKKENTND